MLFSLLRYVNSPQCPFRSVKLTFPVRGHSYMEPDQIFGRIEKRVRKHESILLPDEYREIFREQGSVKVLGDDWRIYNHKQLTDKYIKKNNELSLRDTKRSLFKKGFTNKIWCSNTYRSNFHEYSIVKRNTVLAGLKAPLFPLKSHVSAEKKRDVEQLLDFLHAADHIKEWYTSKL